MLRIAILMIVALSLSLPAQAKPQKNNYYKNKRDAALEQTEVERRASFSPAERNLIRAHLQGEQRAMQKQHKDLPPGLQKKVARGKALPPGWQKKLAPGRSLDYQVYRQGNNLPDILLQRLPPSPIGSEILQVEDKILRLESATRTILDVFDLVPAR